MASVLLKPTDLFDPPAIGCVLDLSGKPQGGNTVWDSSPYANHGTIYGAIWTRLPSGLWVLDYDGTDDYVDCGIGSSLDITEAITVEVWAYRDTEGTFHRLVSKMYDGTTTASCCFQLQFGYGAYVGFRWSVGGVFDAHPGAPQIETWYHIVGTYDRIKAVIYVDGVEIWSDSYTGAIRSNPAEPVTIGCQKYLGNTGSFYLLDGKAALARIYNRALSALEVQNRYNQTKHLFKE